MHINETKRPELVLGTILLLGIGLSELMARAVGSLFVYGGTVCEMNNGVQECWGYVPAGMMFSMIAAALLVFGAVSLKNQGGRDEIADASSNRG